MTRRDFLWHVAVAAKLATGVIVGGTVALLADVYTRRWPKGGPR